MWFLIVLALALLWLIFSIKIVGPDEMAVKVMFGKPKSFCESGFRFVPFLLGFKCYLKRYPKKMYNFAYQEHMVVTQAGKYKDVNYGSQVLKVDSVAYLNFPREKEEVDETHPLIKILRAGIPTDDEKLKDWTEEVVVGALRVAFGKMAWGEAIENMERITQEAMRVFTDVDGALLKAGFRPKGIKLVVEEIKLSEELKKALMEPERARLQADAAVNTAKAQAIERIGTILHSMAQARGISLEDLQKEIQTNPALQEELRKYMQDLHVRLEEAETGALFDFRTNVGGIEGSLANLIALFRRMPGGKGMSGNGQGATPPGEKGRKKRKKRIEDMTDEEVLALDEEEDEEEEEQEGK